MLGAPVSQLPELLASKTVTIAQLMKIVPPDTVDPTPFLFNSTMYTLSCLLGFALMCNMAIRPVNAKHFELVAPPPVIQARDVTQGLVSEIGKTSQPQAGQKNVNE